MTDTTPLLITPETKVGAMLDRYPELIDTLVSLSDRYRNLTNPILRKTVAPRTPLRLAAQMGGYAKPSDSHRLTCQSRAYAHSSTLDEI